jgi:hypothetical protein
MFSLWLGFDYCINAHPRVDSYTESLPFPGIVLWLPRVAGLLE